MLPLAQASGIRRYERPSGRKSVLALKQYKMSDVFAAASLIQAMARQRLMGEEKLRLCARASEYKIIAASVKRRAMQATRSLAFATILGCTSHRLAALRAEVAACRGYKAAAFALQRAREALEVATVGHSELLRAEAGAKWITQYVAERVALPTPPHLRKLLARNWCDLDDNDRCF